MTRVCGRVNKLICRMKAPPDTMGCHDRKPPPKYARLLGATVALRGPRPMPILSIRAGLKNRLPKNIDG